MKTVLTVFERFEGGMRARGETAEAVFGAGRASCTQLKLGVNEKGLRWVLD